MDKPKAMILTAALAAGYGLGKIDPDKVQASVEHDYAHAVGGRVTEEEYSCWSDCAVKYACPAVDKKLNLSGSESCSPRDIESAGIRKASPGVFMRDVSVKLRGGWGRVPQ